MDGLVPLWVSDGAAMEVELLKNREFFEAKLADAEERVCTSLFSWLVIALHRVIFCSIPNCTYGEPLSHPRPHRLHPVSLAPARPFQRHHIRCLGSTNISRFLWVNVYPFHFSQARLRQAEAERLAMELRHVEVQSGRP